MYVWHGQTVREDRVGEASAKTETGDPGEQPLMLRLTRKAAAFAAARPTFLQAIVERRAAVAKRIAVLLRWHSEGGEVRRGLTVGL